MKVAYVLSLFPCHSETFILREILELEARGLAVSIFSLRPPLERVVHESARPLLDRVVYPLPLRGRERGRVAGLLRAPHTLRSVSTAMREARGDGAGAVAKAAFTALAAVQFSAVVQRLRIDHVHAHWATFPALAARIMARATGLRYTLTTHAHDLFLPNAHRATNLGEAARVVTISDYNRRYLEGLGVPESRIDVVRCGLDFEAVQRPQLEPVAGRLVSVGRLVDIKGFPVLIDAVAMLKDRGAKVDCEILGDGPLRDRLQQQIVRHGLQDSVRLRGAVSQDEVMASLGRAELFVLPSVRTPAGDQDGVPVALMEAMALGLPVVTTPVSGIPELVTDEASGLLVPPGDPASLARAIERLLHDAAARADLGGGAQRAVRERHDIKQEAKRLESIFRDVAGVRVP